NAVQRERVPSAAAAPLRGSDGRNQPTALEVEVEWVGGLWRRRRLTRLPMVHGGPLRRIEERRIEIHSDFPIRVLLRLRRLAVLVHHDLRREPSVAGTLVAVEMDVERRKTRRQKQNHAHE